MILVTGSEGFIGRSLMRALQRQGYEARGYEGRINDPHRLRAQLEEIETVIHLASAEARGHHRHLQHVDLEGSIRLLEEAERAHINHIVYLSHLRADPNAMYAPLRVKGQVERLFQASDIPHTIVRSATLYGRYDRFLNVIAGLARWSWPFVWLPADGRAVLQPLWVEDLARCLVAVSDPLDLHGYRGQTLTVAGEERLHYSELVNLVLTAMGIKRRPLPVRSLMARYTSQLIFGWQRRPLVTPFFFDRLSVPEVADLDVVLRTFDFRPSPLSYHLSHLRHPQLAWRVFNPS